MAATQEIMQEYLVKLGYKTDLISLRKFEDSLSSAGKSIFRLGGTVAGVFASMEAASAAFAYSMRKAYFAAELSNSSVKSIQQLSYAGKQFGISADAMEASVKGMAQAIRLNPGLQGLIESFGIKVTGRDMSDVMLDFVKATKGLPEFVGQQYASLFGMDPDTYHQMITHYDEIIGKRREMARLQKDMGVDIDKQKKTIMEYTQTLDRLAARFEVLSVKMMSAMMPAFKKTSQWLDEIMEGWTWYFMSDEERKDYIAERKAARRKKSNPTQGTEQSDLHERIMRGEQVGDAHAKEKLHLSMLEQRYGLPAGVLYGQWGAESGYGKNMLSPKGAQGHFQFMPNTAKEFGLSDPNDFKQSSDAAARKMKGLLKRYGGNVEMALAAYNWGEGNLDKQGVANAPQETLDYVKKITGNDIRLGGTSGQAVSQNNTTTIHVHGDNAQDTANAVAGAQNRVNADNLRMLKGATG